MSSNAAIVVENLSKRYIIAHQRSKDNGLRHAVENALRAPLRYLRDGYQKESGTREEFWALNDINIEVKPGEAVGIIGRNGAGKSTLLKLLSRITEPTSGSIRIRGRVASLLEVGTGFHNELTGRENIFLNGAILGMGRSEIKRKFDEIVAFSGVEKFIDTPVKRYSSGMFVRLAFAVAAHLEPEILIVDEVLAVGDAEFQKKCLEKMDDVGHSGRTVLFVSHNMQAITRLCSRCILLNKGSVKLDGASTDVANAYLRSGLTTTAVREWPDMAKAPGDHVARLCAVRVRSKNGEAVDVIDVRESIGIELEYEVLQPGHIFIPHFSVRNEEGMHLFVAVDVDPAWRGRPRPRGKYMSTGWIPGNLLSEGLMSVQAVLMTWNPEISHAVVDDAVAFRVLDDLAATDTARGDYSKAMPGLVRPLLHWTTQRLTSDNNPNIDLPVKGEELISGRS
jgi:lipopolysaccharide transport system ATP-binding protein